MLFLFQKKEATATRVAPKILNKTKKQTKVHKMDVFLVALL